jgi:hypothetical protein
VSDFGLTVNAYTATYKYVKDGPKPIRYLSPEALRRGRYSEKSDVWAFGVTVWELLSGGDIPFFDITDDDEVVRHVVAGGVLPPPESPAALPLWTAVKPCFAQLPKDRPTFAQLAVTLGSVAGVEGTPGGASTLRPTAPADAARRAEADRDRLAAELERVRTESEAHAAAREEEVRRLRAQLEADGRNAAATPSRPPPAAAASVPNRPQTVCRALKLVAMCMWRAGVNVTCRCRCCCCCFPVVVVVCFPTSLQ